MFLNFFRISVETRQRKPGQRQKGRARGREAGRQAGRQAGEGVTEEEKEEEEEILCVPYAPRRFANEQRMKAMRPPHQQTVLRGAG